jgi:hypothetical protein
MSYTCNFCNAILGSEYSLLKHQKTTKKCIIKQGLVISKGNFKCDMCDETFIFKSVLKSHIISCGKKNSEKIKISEENTLVKSKLLELETKYNMLLGDKKELETKYNMLLGDKKELETKYILLGDKKELETKYNMLLGDKKELETKYNMLLGDKKDWKEKEEKLLDKITAAAFTKTNTVKNNINITTYTRTDEELKTIYADNLTSSHIEGGISAITKLIVDKVVTDSNGLKMITITDKVRGTARYKLPSGEDVVDNGLNIFTTKNRDILMKRICTIASDDKLITEQIMDVDTNISKGYTEISDDVEGHILRSSLIKNI